MDEDDLYSNKFKDILDTFNMTQHVDFPTHIQGDTLDIVAAFGNKPVISNVVSNEYDASHHFLVHFHVGIVPETKQEKDITYGNLKDLNFERFTKDVSENLDISSQSFEDNMKACNEVLKELLDEHAPIKTRTIKVVPNAPWFDSLV